MRARRGLWRVLWLALLAAVLVSCEAGDMAIDRESQEEQKPQEELKPQEEQKEIDPFKDELPVLTQEIIDETGFYSFKELDRAAVFLSKAIQKTFPLITESDLWKGPREYNRFNVASQEIYDESVYDRFSGKLIARKEETYEWFELQLSRLYTSFIDPNSENVFLNGEQVFPFAYVNVDNRGYLSFRISKDYNSSAYIDDLVLSLDPSSNTVAYTCGIGREMFYKYPKDRLENLDINIDWDKMKFTNSNLELSI